MSYWKRFGSGRPRSRHRKQATRPEGEYCSNALCVCVYGLRSSLSAIPEKITDGAFKTLLVPMATQQMSLPATVFQRFPGTTLSTAGSHSPQRVAALGKNMTSLLHRRNFRSSPAPVHRAPNTARQCCPRPSPFHSQPLGSHLRFRRRQSSDRPRNYQQQTWIHPPPSRVSPEQQKMHPPLRSRL